MRLLLPQHHQIGRLLHTLELGWQGRRHLLQPVGLEQGDGHLFFHVDALDGVPGPQLPPILPLFYRTRVGHRRTLPQLSLRHQQTQAIAMQSFCPNPPYQVQVSLNRVIARLRQPAVFSGPFTAAVESEAVEEEGHAQVNFVFLILEHHVFAAQSGQFGLGPLVVRKVKEATGQNCCYSAASQG